MNRDIFLSAENFSAAFVTGLERMLEHDGLGVFILVCANAGFDPQTQHALAPRLQQRFEQTSERYREALRHGRALPDADDDVLVFLKMMAIGFDALQPTQRRHEGPWELQFNRKRPRISPLAHSADSHSRATTPRSSQRCLQPRCA